MIVTTLVPREEVTNVWHITGPLLHKATMRSGNRFHVSDLLVACLNGHQSLWIAMEDGEIIGAVTLSIIAYPGGLKASRIEFLGGKEREKWFSDMWWKLARYSKDQGCETMETTARPGIGEYIKDWGGKETSAFYEFDLGKVKEDG